MDEERVPEMPALRIAPAFMNEIDRAGQLKRIQKIRYARGGAQQSGRIATP